MAVDESLVEAAKIFVQQRFAASASWVGAAAARTRSGRILLSTGFFDVPNDAARLCHETGAICEAHKLDEEIVAIVCVSRDDRGEFVILPPCGICQERLFRWGPEVEAAIPRNGAPDGWETRKLRELQPHYWFAPFINQPDSAG